MIQRSYESLSTSRTSQFVLKIGSRNQSIEQYMATNMYTCTYTCVHVYIYICLPCINLHIFAVYLRIFYAGIQATVNMGWLRLVGSLT